MEGIKSQSPILIINELVLIGDRKNYSVPFAPGLNIIHGDSDTGKTSILSMIDYCMGSSELDLYDEIEETGQYAMLEVSLNNKIYTIKRNIFEPGAFVEVYHAPIKKMDSVFPLLYGPNYTKKGDAGFISDFFLDALSIPKVSIKQAPSKVDSKMKRLSFRDIMKFNYLDQDDVGSKDILDLKNPTVAVRNQEAFKFIHYLLDVNIVELQGLISEKTGSRKLLLDRYHTIANFFKETHLKTREELMAEQIEAQTMFRSIEAELEVLNGEMMANTDTERELRSVIDGLKKDLRYQKERMDSIRAQMKQNIVLKNDYSLDISKLRASVQVSERLPVHEHTMDCPVCNNLLRLDILKKGQQNTAPGLIDKETQSLSRRLKGISDIIEDNRNEIFELQQEIVKLDSRIVQASELLDNNTRSIISPYISQRDGLLSGKTRLSEQLKKIEYNFRLRNQLDEIQKSSDKLEEEIAVLNKTLAEFILKMPTTEQVLKDLATYLYEFLEMVRINNLKGVSINSRTFLPIFREREYSKLTSGGVRTLVSVGYFIALLKNSISTPTNHPRFLMIDTIGKYLGKTNARYLSETDVNEDKKEGMSADDPTKFINMYTYLLQLCGEDQDIQIIVVDNDIPDKLSSELEPKTVKVFSKGSNSLPRGFIDDINYNLPIN